MKYYAYLGTEDLGKEPCGMCSPLPPNGPSAGISKILFELKTDRGALARARKQFESFPFRLYRYTDIYDSLTFREVIQ